MIRNRIVKFGVQPADQFLANPNNPKIHPQTQRDAMKDILSELGWVDVVIVNSTTGYLIDGHERVFQALADNDEVPYIEVELSAEEENSALAMLDAVGRMSEYDRDALNKLVATLSIKSNPIQSMLDRIKANTRTMLADGDLEETQEITPSNYSRKIASPIYEPCNQRPAISDIYNDEKYQKLIHDITSSPGLSDEERSFLCLAATRHIVFNYKKIADLYASASPELQRLMEDSALIIIDFDRAVELGYVQLTGRINAILRELEESDG